MITFQNPFQEIYYNVFSFVDSLRNRVECRTCKKLSKSLFFSRKSINSRAPFKITLMMMKWKKKKFSGLRWCFLGINGENFIITNFVSVLGFVFQMEVAVSFNQKVLKHNGKQVWTWCRCLKRQHMLNAKCFALVFHLFFIGDTEKW